MNDEEIIQALAQEDLPVLDNVSLMVMLNALARKILRLQSDVQHLTRVDMGIGYLT